MQQASVSPIVRFGFALAVAICILSSPVMAFFLTRIFLEARSSANWPTVSGRLERAEVRQTGVGRYYADVEYQFAINGKAYTGSRIAASDGEYDTRDAAVQALQGRHPGQTVTVHYHPADPTKSVLRAGAGFQEYVLLCVPLFVLGLGIYGLVILRRR